MSEATIKALQQKEVDERIDAAFADFLRANDTLDINDVLTVCDQLLSIVKMLNSKESK